MRIARSALLATAVAALAACSDGVAPVSPAKRAGPAAPVLSAAKKGIPDEYIVVLNKDAIPEELLARLANVKAKHLYKHALTGFSAKLTAGQVEVLRNSPLVEYIEQDAEVSVETTQSSPTWGLDRIDQRNLPLNAAYTYTPTGSGVRAYVIDTGINTSHTDFGGRASSGYDAVDGGAATDCNGHGTHVSGTIGSTTYGVAKGVSLVAVRVLDCAGSGTNSGVIAGMDWVTANHIKPAVANMSLGGGASTAIDDAINRMHNAGVTVVVAAGNENQNACNVSPARAANAITVGATTSTDARAYYSNYGSCVDVFAPGSAIKSTWYSSNTATNTIDGTSMASPHVAGIAALYLEGAPTATPATVANAIITTSTTGVVTSAGTGSPNRLVFSLLTTGGTTPPPTGTTYTGSLSGTGANSYQPSTTGYVVSVSGLHTGQLTGTGVDFDLYLQKLSGSTWSTVASSLGTTSTESVSYSGTAGTYRWRVYSYSGSGSYTLVTTKP